MKNNKIKRDILLFLSLFLILILLGENAIYARELKSVVKNLGDELRDFFAIASVVALLAAGMLFYVSRAMGMQQLMNAVWGTIICSASSAIFSMISSLF